jgi:hypothetical protein
VVRDAQLLNHAGATPVLHDAAQQLTRQEIPLEVSQLPTAENESAWHGACSFPLVRIAQQSFKGSYIREMPMRFHDERNKRLHPMGHSPIDALALSDEKFALRRRAILARRPINRSQRSESLLHDGEIADESLVITQCYEAHLAMQQMLAVFADMRGDDAKGPSS